MCIMKTLMIIISLSFTICYGFVSAQTADAVYVQAMTKTVAKLDSSYTVPLLRQQKNQFDRIASTYPKEWLPVYYSAFCNIQSVYMNPKADGNAILLDEAKEKLSGLDKFQDIDKSEINTLWGYYYTAFISLDPQTNGAKYFGQVISFYKEAIAQNEQNPRPLFLLAFFKTNLPAFMQQGKDLCAELSKAEELYKTENRNSITPHWGEEFLQMLKSKCVGSVQNQ